MKTFIFLVFIPLYAAAEGGEYLQTSKFNGKLNLRVISNQSPACSWGDMDAIKFELENSDQKKLIITVEPLLEDGSFKPIVKDVSDLDLSKGIIADFEIPKSDKPLNVAIMVCKDSAGTGKCSGKLVEDTANIVKLYTTPVDPKTKKATAGKTAQKNPVDKVYYFAYANISASEVNTIASSLSDKNFKTLSAKLAQVGEKNIDKVVAAAKNKLNTSRSIQPLNVDGVLTLALPERSKKGCGEHVE